MYQQKYFMASSLCHNPFIDIQNGNISQQRLNCFVPQKKNIFVYLNKHHYVARNVPGQHTKRGRRRCFEEKHVVYLNKLNITMWYARSLPNTQGPGGDVAAKNNTYGFTLVSFISPLSFLTKSSFSFTTSPVLLMVVSLKEMLYENFFPSTFPFSILASPN